MSRSERILYEQEQRWALWVPAVLVLSGGAAVLGVARELSRQGTPGADPPWVLWSALVVVLATLGGLALNFDKLRIRITPSAVVAVFGTMGWVRKRIPWERIERASAVTYRPLRDFGGWGLRFGWTGTRRAWTVAGDRALLLELTDGTRFYLGAERPERLLARMEAAAGRRWTGADG